jgi:hypothetical protein
MVGHALVEHTVGEVTPAIRERRDQVCIHILLKLSCLGLIETQ